MYAQIYIYIYIYIYIIQMYMEILSFCYIRIITKLKPDTINRQIKYQITFLILIIIHVRYNYQHTIIYIHK